MSAPLLLEVPPSPSNVALPCEAFEEWVAVRGGGFQKPIRVDDLPMSCLSTVSAPPRDKRAAIKKSRKAASADYFVVADRCMNTACTLQPGHGGLCSHQVVFGKRGKATPKRFTPA